MRAKFVNDIVGERKKQLASSDVYVITGTGNISGGGDLFIKNENSGQVEKCYTRDWEDPRKYTSMIMEFEKTNDITKGLQLGKHRIPKVGDIIVLHENIVWNNQLEKWVKAIEIGWVQAGTYEILNSTNGHGKFNINGYLFSESELMEITDLWDYGENDINEFQRGGDMKTTLDIGDNRTPELGSKWRPIRNVFYGDCDGPWFTNIDDYNKYYSRGSTYMGKHTPSTVYDLEDFENQKDFINAFLTNSEWPLYVKRIEPNYIALDPDPTPVEDDGYSCGIMPWDFFKENFERIPINESEFKREKNIIKALDIGDKRSETGYEEMKSLHMKQMADMQKTLRVMRGYHSGDDSPYGGGDSVADTRRQLRYKIKQIKEKYETEEEKKKRYARIHNAAKKRHDKYSAKRKEKRAKLKLLTPKQVAINKLVDLISSRSRTTSRDFMTRKKTRNHKAYNKYTKQIDKIKAEFGIKSHDIRRQREYDPIYEMDFQRNKDITKSLAVGNSRPFKQDDIIRMTQNLDTDDVRIGSGIELKYGEYDDIFKRDYFIALDSNGDYAGSFDVVDLILANPNSYERVNIDENFKRNNDIKDSLHIGDDYRFEDGDKIEIVKTIFTHWPKGYRYYISNQDDESADAVYLSKDEILDEYNPDNIYNAHDIGDIKDVHVSKQANGDVVAFSDEGGNSGDSLHQFLLDHPDHYVKKI